MTKAFIVNLDTGSDTDFIGVSSEIQDALEKEGMDVISVAPWSSPIGLSGPSQSPIPPTPPTIL